MTAIKSTPPPGGGALIQGSPKKTRGKLETCSTSYWREAPKCFIYPRNTLVCYLDWWNSLLSVLYHLKFSLKGQRGGSRPIFLFSLAFTIWCRAVFLVFKMYSYFVWKRSVQKLWMDTWGKVFAVDRNTL